MLCKKYRLVVALLVVLVGVMLFSCTKKDEVESTQTNLFAVSEDSKELEHNTKTVSPSSTQESEESSSPSEYGKAQQWGRVSIAQKKIDIPSYSIEDERVLLRRIAHAVKNYIVLPHDTQIGILSDLKKGSQVTRENMVLLSLVQDFFRGIQEGNINEDITDIVMKEEIFVVLRQISQVQNYGKEIHELRLGNISIENPFSRSVVVRIFREGEIKSNAQFLFYFTQDNFQWRINAVEGDFDQLEEPYQHPGNFVPLGTTSVLQGF